MPRKKPVDYQRVRGSKACTFCSRRKIRCDGCEPCSVCKSRSFECTYVQRKKRGPPPKTAHQQPPQQQPPQQQPPQQQPPQQQPQQQPQPRRNSHHRMPSVAPSSVASQSDHVDDHAHRVAKRARFQHHSTQSAHASCPSLQPTALDELATVAYQSRANTPADHATSSTPASVSHAELDTLLSLPAGSHPFSTFSFPHSAARHPHLSPATSPLALPYAVAHARVDSPLNQLSKLVVDQLLTVYQSFVHLHWPIIYLPSLSSLHVLAHSHPLLFHAVLAVAAGTQDNHAPHSLLTTLPSAPFHHAPSSPTPPPSHMRAPAVCPPGTAAKLVAYLHTQVRAQHLARTLETIQVLILLALVHMGGGDTSDASLHAGMACLLAIELGLHRQHSASKYSQSYRPQERQRVLWGCYVLDKTLAAAFERPIMLRCDDIDVHLPSTQESDEYDIFVNDRSRLFIAPNRLDTMSHVKCRCISSFRSYCELMMLLESILIQVYSPKSKLDRKQGNTAKYQQSVLELDSHLRTWRRQLPPHLQWKCSHPSDILAHPVPHPPPAEQPIANRAGIDTQHVSDDNVPPQVLTMRAWYSACMLLLHRPRLPLDMTHPQRANLASSDHASSHAKHTPLPTKSSSTTFGAQAAAQPPTTCDQSQANTNRGILAIPGSQLVRAAATEICDLLPKYQATFSVRRIPSSWVYLIFQSAIIHSSFLETNDNHTNQSGQLFHQCIRNLEQMALTWRGASHHVATLRRVAESCRITRPSTPVLAHTSLATSPQLSSSMPGLLLSESLGSGSVEDALAHMDAVLDPALDTPSADQIANSTGADWLDFWSQMPSSSEDVWLWHNFMDSYATSVV